MSRTYKDTKRGRQLIGDKYHRGVEAWWVGRLPNVMKRLWKRQRRAKDKAALLRGKEPEHWRKSDKYDLM